MKYLKLLVFLLFLVSFVSAFSPIPDTFSGSVKISGEDAPIGTEIELYVNNDYIITYPTTEVGTYEIDVKNGTTGNPIAFKILNQIAETATRTGGLITTLPLSVEGDLDEDGVNDGEDNLIGDATNIDNNYDSISTVVNGTSTLPGTMSGTQTVEIKDGDDVILSFNFDFDSANLNFYDLVVQKGTGDLGSWLVSGIPDDGLVGTKSAYVNKLNDTSGYVCIKDSAITDIDVISAKCNSTDATETLVRCDGAEHDDYTCTESDDKYYITGLSHSGVKEYACTEAWSCGGWSGCSGGTQTRGCSDTNNCGTTLSVPPTSQSCDSGGGDNPGGGSPGGGSGIPAGLRNLPPPEDEEEEVEEAVDDGEDVVEDTSDDLTEEISDSEETVDLEQPPGFLQNLWDGITGMFTGGPTGAVVVEGDRNANPFIGITLIFVVIGLGTLFVKRKSISKYFKGRGEKKISEEETESFK